jgi:hypothetical protein
MPCKNTNAGKERDIPDNLRKAIAEQSEGKK